ncbi:MAG: hypothetical protein WAX80_00500 [Minisyncoccia bacterium]
MRKYLATLYQRPDHHKKQFALLASSTITLFIFGIWSLTTFGIRSTSESTVAVVEVEKQDEVSPLQPLRDNLASGLDALRSSFGELKAGLKSVDIESEYENLRDGALDVYGK